MSESAAKRTDSGIRLYCMCGGILTFDQSTFTHMQGMGKRIEVPTPIFLIDHPEGKVLFETGLHPEVSTNPDGHWGQRARDWNPRVSPDQAVHRQLASLGVRPTDIRFVVLSCLLPDHAGGMQAFPEATFLVQFQELQDAWWPDRRYMPKYEFEELLPTRAFRFLELYGDDLDIFGDGRVVVLASPAHTRGEQALVARLPRTGTVVLPAGVIPQKANLDRGVMTGTPRMAPAVVHASMARLKKVIQQEHAMVIFHHDPEEWKRVRLAPEYYE
jgi:N-acyl homoserine lactone hydrolase